MGIRAREKQPPPVRLHVLYYVFLWLNIEYHVELERSIVHVHASSRTLFPKITGGRCIRDVGPLVFISPEQNVAKAIWRY